MAVLILVLGGVISAASAFAAWLLGANVFVLVAVYFTSGIVFSSSLLYRLYRSGDTLDDRLLRKIDLEMLALREHLTQDQEASQGKATQDPSIFAMLRKLPATPRR